MRFTGHGRSDPNRPLGPAGVDATVVSGAAARHSLQCRISQRRCGKNDLSTTHACLLQNLVNRFLCCCTALAAHVLPVRPEAGNPYRTPRNDGALRSQHPLIAKGRPSRGSARPPRPNGYICNKVHLFVTFHFKPECCRHFLAKRREFMDKKTPATYGRRRSIRDPGRGG